MLRTLIIDDEPANRRFLELAMRAHGPCSAAATAEQGLEEHRRALTRAEPFGLVFLDLLLPGMDGLRALEHLRAVEDEFALPEDRRAHVVVTTVLDDDRSASRAFISGRASSYMIKPFTAAELRRELEKLGLLPPAGVAS